MGKDAYYFSHDSNAKDDPKCVLLIEQLGLEGYGIYWVLVETLREQTDFRYPLALIPALARRFNTTTEKMKTVVSSYGLFVIEDERFFSLSLIERMNKMELIREKRREAGKISAQKRNLLPDNSANAQQVLNMCSANEEHLFNNEKKVKEIKLNENEIKKESRAFAPPSLQEVTDYCSERRNGVDPQRFIDFYSAKGWVVGKVKMKDWKAAVRTWENRNKEDGNGRFASNPAKGNGNGEEQPSFDYSKFEYKG
jgi:hypothetical protein